MKDAKSRRVIHVPSACGNIFSCTWMRILSGIGFFAPKEGRVGVNKYLAMVEVIQFIIQHAYPLVFLFVLADQIGPTGFPMLWPQEF
jgi:hypothetical protein